MAGVLYTGFDIARTGSMGVSLQDTGGPYSISLTSGTHAHIDLSGISATSGYTTFASALKTAFDAASSETYTFTWSSTTRKYTIAGTSTFSLTFTGDAGTRLKAALGFTGNKSGSTSYTSDVAAYYAVPLARSQMSGYSRPFEREGYVKRSTSVNGTDYSVNAITIPSDVRFRLLYQPLADTFEADIVASSPWSMEHAIKHARCHQPIACVYDSDPSVVIKLSADFAAFSERLRSLAFAQSSDYHGLWHVTLEGRYLGAL